MLPGGFRVTSYARREVNKETKATIRTMKITTGGTSANTGNLCSSTTLSHLCELSPVFLCLDVHLQILVIQHLPGQNKQVTSGPARVDTGGAFRGLLIVPTFLSSPRYPSLYRKCFSGFSQFLLLRNINSSNLPFPAAKYAKRTFLDPLSRR